MYIDKLNTYCKKQNYLTTPMVESCISFMKEKPSDPQQFAELLKFLDVIDGRRKNDWRTLWPEFLPYYNNGEN